MGRNNNRNGRNGRNNNDDKNPTAMDRFRSARLADQKEAERRDIEAAEAEQAAEKNGAEPDLIRAVAQVLKYQGGYTPQEHFRRECDFTSDDEDITIAKIQGILDIVEEHPAVAPIIMQSNQWQIDPNLAYRYMTGMTEEDRQYICLVQALRHEMVFRAITGGTYTRARRSGDQDVPSFQPEKHTVETLVSWEGDEPEKVTQITVTNSFPAYRASYAPQYFNDHLVKQMEYIETGHSAANVVTWTYQSTYNQRNFLLIYRTKRPDYRSQAGEVLEAFAKIVS